MAVASSMMSIPINPAREMVSSTPINASPMARAPKTLRYLEHFEVIAATKTGAVVQRYIERLLESSSDTYTRWT